MIFTTVGTHEQPFNRLVEYMDNWAKNHDEKVVIQTGYSSYEPKYCEWHKLLPYSEMEENVKDARIVITHGGPSSYIMPLQMGKIPIVVPRRYEFGEHVNDHQVDFCKAVAERIGAIIVVDNIDKLDSIIKDYNKIISDMNNDMGGNNYRFCTSFESIVNELFEEK